MSSATPSLQTWVLPQYFHTILRSSAQSLHIHGGFVPSRCGPGAAPVIQLFALGLFELPHEELLLLGLILPSLVTSSRCPTEPQISTYPVGLNHASPGVELHCFQPCSLLLFHPDQERKSHELHPCALHAAHMAHQAANGIAPLANGSSFPGRVRCGAACPGSGPSQYLQEQERSQASLPSRDRGQTQTQGWLCRPEGSSSQLLCSL